MSLYIPLEKGGVTTHAHRWRRCIQKLSAWVAPALLAVASAALVAVAVAPVVDPPVFVGVAIFAFRIT